MIKKFNFGMIMVGVIAAIIVAFTSAHTLHFIGMTLAKGQEIFAYAALAALDGGMIGWAMVYRGNGLSSTQRYIAIALVITDFIGVSATTIADTLYNTGIMGITYEITPTDMTNSLIMITIVILANVAGAIAFPMFDPEQQKRNALNEIMAETHDQTIRTLKAEIPAAAERLARTTADSILNEHSTSIIAEARERDARTRKLDAQRKPTGLNYPDYEERETAEVEHNVKLLSLEDLQPNPTPGRNGRRGAK